MPATHTIKTTPELERALGESGEKEYRRLLRTLRKARGGFFLFPVESDFPKPLRDALLKRLRADLAEEGNCLRVLARAASSGIYSLSRTWKRRLRKRKWSRLSGWKKHLPLCRNRARNRKPACPRSIEPAAGNAASARFRPVSRLVSALCVCGADRTRSRLLRPLHGLVPLSQCLAGTNAR